MHLTSQSPYSPFRVANNLVFVSGQLGIDPATGNLVEGGVKEQTVCNPSYSMSLS